MSDLISPLVNLFTPLLNRSAWLGDIANGFAINSIVNRSRHRPHPWSTVHPYVSWRSLSDTHFSARHLPEKPEQLPFDDESLQPFIELFRRPKDHQVLSDKSTCLFPTFAQYLTDGFIRTRMPSGNDPITVRLQNTSNHQIDLCPLYGRTIEQTDALREKSSDPSRFGRLKTQIIDGGEYAPFLFDENDQTKEEFKELDPPLGVKPETPPEQRRVIFAFGGDRANGSPQVAMMNTLFLREHNRLAGLIAKANPSWDDERVFQTARNANIVLFIKIVVEDYINHISPSGFRFRANPSVAWNAPWNKPNWITTEFSLLYRWHSLLPDNVVWNDVTMPVGSTILNNNPLLAGGLAKGFESFSAQKAAHLGPLNTADALLDIEKLAIMQGRLVKLASYGDYRAYVSLPRPQKFEDISSRPEVVALLKKLYGTPDKVEFYTGLFSEDPTPNSPLPPLLLSMVATDAFSQALTNPLLSEHVFNEGTFSKVGWDAINNTSRLADVVARNVSQPVDKSKITMTQPSWHS